MLLGKDLRKQRDLMQHSAIVNFFPNNGALKDYETIYL